MEEAAISGQGPVESVEPSKKKKNGITWESQVSVECAITLGELPSEVVDWALWRASVKGPVHAMKGLDFSGEDRNLSQLWESNHDSLVDINSEFSRLLLRTPLLLYFITIRNVFKRIEL
jgi:hypothetical protein